MRTLPAFGLAAMALADVLGVVLAQNALMALHPLAVDPYLGLKAGPRASWRLWPTLAEPLSTDPVTEVAYRAGMSVVFYLLVFTYRWLTPRARVFVPVIVVKTCVKYGWRNPGQALAAGIHRHDLPTALLVALGSCLGAFVAGEIRYRLLEPLVTGKEKDP